MAVTINIPNALRQAVESASEGKNTIVFNGKGYPSYMVVIPKFNLDTIDAAWPATPHGFEFELLGLVGLADPLRP